MAGNAYRRIYVIAAEQFGYVTAAQARDLGVEPNALVMMAKRSALERPSHGVYRLTEFPVSPLGAYMEATLWPGGTRGVISHQSALALYEVSDVSPARIHLAVARSFRTHRAVPRHLCLHRADLPASEVNVVEGIPVTTLERAITDCARAHLGPELIGQAIDEGLKAGHLSRTAARFLRQHHLSR